MYATKKYSIGHEVPHLNFPSHDLSPMPQPPKLANFFSPLIHVFVGNVGRSKINVVGNWGPILALKFTWLRSGGGLVTYRMGNNYSSSKNKGKTRVDDKRRFLLAASRNRKGSWNLNIPWNQDQNWNIICQDFSVRINPFIFKNRGNDRFFFDRCCLPRWGILSSSPFPPSRFHLRQISPSSPSFRSHGQRRIRRRGK